jgi:hypothetical protein
MPTYPTRHWWTRDETAGTIVLVQDGADGICVAEVPDPWCDDSPSDVA